MRERIKELAEQAGPMQEVLTKISEQNDDKGPRYVKNIGLLDFQLEKFAELIVRECAGLFEIEWGEEKLTGNDVGYVVKKHFGVDGMSTEDKKTLIKELLGVLSTCRCYSR